MQSKPLGIFALAFAMVAAAGVGSYMALRSNPTQAAPAAAVAPSTAAPASAAPASSPNAKPVAETEAVVTPATPAPAPVEASQGGGSSGTRGRSADDARPTSGSGSGSGSAGSGSTGSGSTAAPRRPASRPEPPVNAQRRPTVPASQAPATTTARRDTVPATLPRPTNAPAEPGANGQNRPTLESEQARVTPPPAEPIAPAPPPPPPEPPKPQFAEYVLDSGSVMGLQIENTVSSATAKIEDRVDARVTRDVRIGGDVAVPAGSRLRGEVTLVEEGGKFKEQARLGIRFHTLVLADGTSVPIATETIYRVGDQMGQRSAAKIGGGAIGGAIIGAILGGGKGAAIGGAAGAGAGTAATMAGNRSTAVMQAGSTYTVRLTQPATVRVEKEN